VSSTVVHGKAVLDARSSRCAVQKFITGLMGGHRPFLRETPVEKLFRFRGVIAVISVPVMLIVLVAGLMPRASTDLHDPHQEAEYGFYPYLTLTLTRGGARRVYVPERSTWR
jgi:hypothetical protein